MSAKRSPFVQVARDPYEGWYRLDSDTRMLGPALALRFGNEGLLADITLAELPDLLCRDLAIDAKKRPAFRQRVARLIAEALLIETPEGVRLLWSREAYLAHRPKRPIVEPSVTHATPIEQPPVTHPELSLENHSIPVAQKERKKERIKRPPPAGAPKARPRDEQKAVLTRVLSEAGERHGFLPANLLSAKQGDAVIKKAADFARREATDLEAALRRTVDEAWERHQREGKELKWCVVDWQPNAARRPSLRYTGPQPCSPESHFPDVDIEDQIRQMREQGRAMREHDARLRAENLRREALRKAAS